jgi:hypothetical protein
VSAALSGPRLVAELKAARYINMENALAERPFYNRSMPQFIVTVCDS